MGDVFDLPGYTVGTLLGFGATGEVWHAVEVTSGEEVVLKRLQARAATTTPVATDGEDAGPSGTGHAAAGPGGGLRGAAALMAVADTPHLVRLRAVVDDVLVYDYVPGGSLATLLARRGPDDPFVPGEVVTVAAPLAQALAALHAAGVVHGGVTPTNVLFTRGGMPMLSDLGALGAAAVPGPPGDHTTLASGDVQSLGAICRLMLGETSAAAETVPAMVEAIAAALQPDPASRPDAATFARTLRHSCAPLPLRMRGPAPAADSSSAGGSSRRGGSSPALPAPPASRVFGDGSASSRPALVAGIGVLVLAMAGAVGWGLGRSGPTGGGLAVVPPVPPVASATPRLPDSLDPPLRDPDWAQTLDELDAVRARAFATASAALLDQVHLSGSQGLRTDRAAVTALARVGHRATGVRHTVRSVTLLKRQDDQVRLLVVDRLAPQEIRDHRGDLVERLPARPPAGWTMTLRRGSAADSRSWRIAAVARAPMPVVPSQAAPLR